MENRQVYDLLLSKRWIYRVCAIEDYRTGILTIGSTNKLEKVVDGQKTDFLAIEPVDMLEVKDLRMNLADEMVYELINKANEAKYYYNQVKS